LVVKGCSRHGDETAVTPVALGTPMLDSGVALAGDKMWYQACVDVLVIVHLLFISFVVCGVFLAW
jgi:hypothetical protein